MIDPFSSSQLFSGAGLRIAVLVSRYNSEVSGSLLEGAKVELDRAGVSAARVTIETVPGAFELPLAAKVAAKSGRHDAVVALGAVIRGETDHYRYVCEAATHGILQATLETGVPIAFGVLTTATEEQALARAGNDDPVSNKGAEAVRVAIEMVHKLRRLGG